MCACMTMLCGGMNSSTGQVGTAWPVPALCQASPYSWIHSIGPTVAQSANLILLICKERREVEDIHLSFKDTLSPIA